MRNRLAVLSGVALIAGAIGVANAGEVTTADDDTNAPSTTSLRYALLHLAAGNNTVTINIASATTPVVIDLKAVLPLITSNVTITGPGASKLTVHLAAGAGSIFSITGGVTVQLSGMTITGGGNDTGGAGVLVGDTTSSLTLTDCTLTANTSMPGSGFGAAVSSNGPLTIQRSSITGNFGLSAVYGASDTTIVDTTIDANMGTGAIFQLATGKTAQLTRTTISGNSAAIDTEIGGLDVQSGTVNITDSTFSGNMGGMGGDLWLHGKVSVALTNATAANSSVPALRFDQTAGSTATMVNTLIAGSGARCGGAAHPTSMGHNLASDATCNLTDSTDKPGVDPKIAAIGDNGGLTLTHALLPGSPALNAGTGRQPTDMDQRQLPRVQFSAVDIGAVEASAPLITQPPHDTQVAPGDTLTLSVTAENQHSTAPLTFQWRKDGTAITGATAAMFSKPNAQQGDAGSYDVLVGNEFGPLASSAAQVFVGNDVAGCCSTSGGPASSGLLALAVVALLCGRRQRRRPRAASQRHSG